MDNDLLQDFHDLTTARTGLLIRDKDRAEFRAVLASRIKELKLASATEYYQLLAGNGASNEPEWKRLVARLTNGESYFFRDQGQIALLRNTLLPELIERNRPRRTLRIWSAGCSTGEEPHTLAMLVHELLPQRGGWKILILGTDINDEVLARARQGLYGDWSFRNVDDRVRERYFTAVAGGWQLVPEIRAMVTWGHTNLRRDNFPSQTTQIQDMDLIVCRNVLIYFDRAAVGAVLTKFAATLSPGGYLLTGHAELSHQDLGPLRTRLFPESAAYQRPPEGDSPVTPLRAPPPQPAPRRAPAAAPRKPVNVTPPSPQKPPRPAPVRTEPIRTEPAPQVPQPAVADRPRLEAQVRQGAYAEALQTLEPLLQRMPDDYELLYLAAVCNANLGRHEAALHCCRQAIAANGFDARAYHIMAHVLEEQGDLHAAKELFKKVIYLAPTAVAAYLELSSIYRRENDIIRARQMRATALDLLQAMSPDAIVESYDGTTAAALISALQGDGA